MPFSQDLTGLIEPTAKTWLDATPAQRAWYYGQLAKLAERKKRVELMQAIGRYGVMDPRKRPRADGADGPVMDPHGGASRAFKLLASSGTAKGCKLYWRAGGAIVSKSGTIYFTDVLSFHAQGLVRGAPIRDVRLSDESIKALRAEGESVWRKRPKQSGAAAPTPKPAPPPPAAKPAPKPKVAPVPIKLSKTGPIHVPTAAFKTILPPKPPPPTKAAPAVSKAKAAADAKKAGEAARKAEAAARKAAADERARVAAEALAKAKAAAEEAARKKAAELAAAKAAEAAKAKAKTGWTPRPQSEFKAFTNGRAMDDWGEEAYQGWATELPVLERNAIRVYTGDNYKWMNAILRGQVPDEMPGAMGMANARRYIENAAAGLRRGQTPEPIVTYRGVQDSAAMGLPDPSKLAAGQELTIEGFGSTTLARSNAAQFASAEGWLDNMLIMQVNQPKGSTGGFLNAGDLSQYAEEREFLMPPGAKMRFVGMGAPHVLTGGREVPVAIFERVE